ncbi:hypothetical protein Q8A73_020443 [Channa argus]|nr:hypothetical protein Q8A73_020443 [Channa argus]
MDGGQYKLCGDQRIPNQGNTEGGGGGGSLFSSRTPNRGVVPRSGIFGASPLLFRSLLLLWEMGGPEKALQKEELFESSVIQKRLFNAAAYSRSHRVRENRHGESPDLPHIINGERSSVAGHG